MHGIFRHSSPGGTFWVLEARFLVGTSCLTVSNLMVHERAWFPFPFLFSMIENSTTISCRDSATIMIRQPIFSQVTVTFSIHMARFFRGAATKALLMCLAEFKLMAFLDGSCLLEGGDDIKSALTILSGVLYDDWFSDHVNKSRPSTK